AQSERACLEAGPRVRADDAHVLHARLRRAPEAPPPAGDSRGSGRLAWIIKNVSRLDSFAQKTVWSTPRDCRKRGEATHRGGRGESPGGGPTRMLPVPTACCVYPNRRGLRQQPVVKRQRRTEGGEAPRRQGATTEHIVHM